MADEQLSPRPDPEVSETPAEPHPVALAVLAKSMPWAISLLLHVGIAMLLMLLVMIVQTTPAETPPIHIPGLVPENMTQQMNFSSVENPTKQKARRAQSHTPSRKRSANLTPNPNVKLSNIIGARGGNSGGSASAFGKLQTGTDSGIFGLPVGDPRSNGGNTDDIVYVIDRSGSMIDTFETVRMEMVRSIGRLQPAEQVGRRRTGHSFHVIFFAEGKPQEMPTRRLVSATLSAKIQAVKFMQNIVPQNQTDPLPAIKRAFEVLSRVKNPKRNKLIYLLTDGVFPDNDKVLRMIRKYNAGRNKVSICTILYGNRPPEAEAVLKQIAKENTGRYKYITAD